MGANTTIKTADLCDEHSKHLQIAEPIFRDFGGVVAFGGPMVTIKAFEDNSLVRQCLEEPGEGRVLVVDGGGSKRCALVGDVLAGLGQKNGWAGILVNGCIRDSADVAQIAIGVKALATHPLKSAKRNIGERNAPVRFANVGFFPGHYLYADEDGVIISETALL